jgi:hypothetical protein
MSQPKQGSKRKHRACAVPLLSAAGLSLSLTSGASAVSEGPASVMPTQNTEVSHEVIFGEEEISDVSLATFYVFDKENPQTSWPPVQLARGGGGGGCGCGGGGCGHGGGCGGGGGCARAGGGCGGGGCAHASGGGCGGGGCAHARGGGCGGGGCAHASGCRSCHGGCRGCHRACRGCGGCGCWWGGCWWGGDNSCWIWTSRGWVWTCSW